MNPRRILFFGFFFSVACSYAEQPTRTFTWQQTVEFALKNNPDLLAAGKSRDAARATLNRSYNGVMPTLGLSSRYTDSDAHLRESRWGAAANANIELLNLRNIAAIKSASAALDQAEASYKIASANLRFNLRQAFADLLLSQEQVKVSQRILNLRKNDAQMVSLKYDSGRESKGNMLRSNAERADAEANLADAQRQLRAAQATLNQQMGLDQFDVIAASETMNTPASIPLPDSASLTLSHPKVAAQRATLDASAAQINDARSTIWPTLSGSYTRSFQGSNYFPDNASWAASGILSYPLFSGGPTYTYYAVSAAKRNYESAQADLRSIQNQVRATIENAWANLAKSIDQVGVQALFLNAAQQRNDESTVRYSSGLMTYETWELAVSDLVNFERSALRSKRDAVVAQASWEQSIGKTLEE